MGRRRVSDSVKTDRYSSFQERKKEKKKQRLQLFLRTTDDSFGRSMTRAVGSKLVEGLEESYLGDAAVK